MNFIPYTKQTVTKDDFEAIKEALNSDFVTRGPLVETFEQKCATTCGAKYALSFNSGSQALTAAYYAAELSENDTLMTSPNTFVGTIAGALQKTSKLQFVDIDLKTLSPNFDQIQKPKSGRAFIIPIHFAGMAKSIRKPFKDCILIEDGCQAFGSKYINREPVGSCPFSDMTVFSFHPAKTLCTGEGGLVTTNSKHYYKRLKLFRNNGIVKEPEFDPWEYQIVDLTTNSNVTEFQAALGLSQLKHLLVFLENRRACVKRYRKNLSDLDFIELTDSSYDEISAHNLFPIRIDFEKIGLSRKEVMIALKNEGIGTQVHFIPLYRHPYFIKHFDLKFENYPHMELYYSRALSLPLYSHLKLEQVDHICEVLLKVCAPTLCRPA